MWNGEKALIWQFYSLTQKTEVMTDESSDCKHQCIKHQWRYQSFILIPRSFFALRFVQVGCTARSKITVESTMRRNFCFMGFYQCKIHMINFYKHPCSRAHSSNLRLYRWISLLVLVSLDLAEVFQGFLGGLSLKGLEEMKHLRDPKD